ncbi:hypothetical protein [Streptomyces sp. SBT349]|uniref:hypothetical protein n=1 Tax=Streptomyces sp. SBT349 TaxID=1580539 RepID=UPI00066CC5AE|nr:hypothetical protein [Streptomyces sp. SBT349]
MTTWFLPRPPVLDEAARPAPEGVPLVWPTARPRHVDEHGYVPATGRDHGRIRPAVAAFVIAAYTRPGSTVLDPDCGAGTVVVEAVRAGRHAVGLTSGRGWWTIARANLTAARRELTDRGVPGDGTILDQGTLPGQLGTVDLLLTSWRHSKPAPGRPAASPLPGGEATGGDRLAALLNLCRPLLAPDGYVVVVARPRRRDGYMLDGPGQITAAARAARLVPHARCVAMVAGLADGRARVEISLAQRRALARHERATGHPVAATAHHDVLVFRAPHAAAQAAAVSAPAAPTSPRRLLAAAGVGAVSRSEEAA